MWICPEENTMALGGVPIGSMKAQLAPKVNAMVMGMIGRPAEMAKLATTGIKTVTNAKLDSTSVANMAIKTTINMIQKTG